MEHAGIFGYTTVPAPIADKSLVWGYRFDGPATGIQMFNAIVAADPRLYAVEVIYPAYGTSVYGIGFHLGGGGDLALRTAAPPIFSPMAC